MCQAGCHYCTQKRLFRYALALEKASGVLCGECSCQFLISLAIIQGGSYPEVSVKLCHPCLLLLQDAHKDCEICARYINHTRLLFYSP